MQDLEGIADTEKRAAQSDPEHSVACPFCEPEEIDGYPGSSPQEYPFGHVVITVHAGEYSEASLVGTYAVDLRSYAQTNRSKSFTGVLNRYPAERARDADPLRAARALSPIPTVMPWLALKKRLVSTETLKFIRKSPHVFPPKVPKPMLTAELPIPPTRSTSTAAKATGNTRSDKASTKATLVTIDSS